MQLVVPWTRSWWDHRGWTLGSVVGLAVLGDILVNLFLAIQENVREGDNPPVGFAHGLSFVLFDDATDVVFAWGLRHHFYGPSIKLLAWSCGHWSQRGSRTCSISSTSRPFSSRMLFFGTFHCRWIPSSVSYDPNALFFFSLFQFFDLPNRPRKWL